MLETMSFSGKWRDYQQDILEQYERFAHDGRVHVVAAPGSGKTVLGLELVRRLDRPALILAPSLTIRDQWYARLVPLFMDAPPSDCSFSFRLDRPGQITAVTYQALHAIWSDIDSTRFGSLLQWARDVGPITLVLDEAHHLRREWWRALDALFAGLEDHQVVALTATPPYDAPFAEWQRYEAACGPIDIEIGIPELVRNGDLCPHQDHVVFAAPSANTLALLDARRESVSAIAADVRSNEALLEAIAAHPWLIEPDQHIEAVLDKPEVLSAMLVHLAQSGRKLPRSALALLGVSEESVPPQTGFWLETLLNGLLFDLEGTGPLSTIEADDLRHSLHRLGLIEGDRVRLRETKRILRIIAGDRGKLRAIAEIARAESRACGDRLRMVVLADHVRAEELPRNGEAKWQAARIGVAPIFEMLRRMQLPNETVGVLTGTLVVLPTEAIVPLRQAMRAEGIADRDVRDIPLPHCASHCRIEAINHANSALVRLVTDLFVNGQVTILVGTQALLGEGWDAPAINSLVLASNTTSFMLSNQMRGRAIRIDPVHPDKVANIWHLATTEELPLRTALEAIAHELTWGSIAEGADKSADIGLLNRRFSAFAGISNCPNPAIESGLARLQLSQYSSIDAANAATFARAADRTGIARDWAISVGDAPPKARVREIAAARYAPRQLSWQQTIQWLALGGASSGAATMAWQAASSMGTPGLKLLAVAFVAGTAVALPKFARAALLTARNGSLERSLGQVGRAVLNTLVTDGTIDRVAAETTDIVIKVAIDGRHDIHFAGLWRSAERAAVQALTEVLGPVGNPRYLLVRRTPLLGTMRADYHAVPAQFGRNKTLAEAFAAEWERLVGPSDLVLTRSADGRRTLLKARARSLAAGFQRRIDRRSAWM